MAELKNCYNCGELFLAFGDKILCKKCEKTYRDYYIKINTYLKNNKDATLSEILNIDVPEKAIRLFLKGKTLIPGKSPIEYKKCIICGKKILTGRICSICKSKLLK